MRKDPHRLFRSYVIMLPAVALCIGLLLYCDRPSTNPALAAFDSGTVVESEVIDHYLLSTQYKPKVQPSEQLFRDIVRQKALDKMLVMEAQARGLAEDSVFKALVKNHERKAVFYKYMRQEIISRVITDSLMRLFYANYSPQYAMRYIIRPVVKSSTPAFERSQKDTIEVIYRLLKSGEKFEDLANRYSQDITTNRKGGDLGFVIRESLGDAALRAVMDTLKEFSYSKPFRGYEGWYILYKGEKRVVPVPPYEAVKDRIWQTLYRTRKHLIRQQVEERFAELAQKYHYQLYPANQKVLLDKADVKDNASDYQVVDFSALTEQDLSLVLARHDGGLIRAAELFENRRREPQTLLDFKERFTAAGEQHLLGQHGLDSGMQNDPEIVNQVHSFKESLLRSRLLQKAVKDPANARTDSLRQTLAQQEKPEEVRKLLGQKYFEFERANKALFEEQLLKKYHFHYIDKHFSRALKEAGRRKEEQNKKTEKSAPAQTRPK
ncbi:hypothetical protein GX408_06860 [bacterium]|nr:hypothetical protein [bacterium]